MARKTKYDPETFPKLVEGYAREGLNDYQIWYNLGISKDSFYKYIKRYKEFADGLKKGRAPVDFEVENALLKRCLGYDYEEKMQEVKTDSSGDIIEKHVKKTIKHYPPDIGAIQTWLSNRKNDIWKRNPDLKSNNKNKKNAINALEELAKAIRESDLEE